jgi:hypothetical protein
MNIGTARAEFKRPSREPAFLLCFASRPHAFRAGEQAPAAGA